MAAAESLVAAAPPPSPPGTIFPLELETKVVEDYAKIMRSFTITKKGLLLG